MEKPIAINKASFRVDIIPQQLDKGIDVVPEVAKLLELEPEDVDRIRAELATSHGFRRYRSRTMSRTSTVGFPFDRGRLDESEHPFTEGVPGDVRVTTRFDTAEPFSGLLGALHETGHAMYDVGPAAGIRRSARGPRPRHGARREPVAAHGNDRVPQPRLRAATCKPLLEKHFGVSGPEWSEENLYAHLTRVKRGPIRVDADELTYTLHIQLRYELENQLLSGELRCATCATRGIPAWSSGSA